MTVVSVWLTPLLLVSGWWGRHVYRSWRAGCCWTAMQKRMMQGVGLSIALQLVNATTFLAVSALSLTQACSWFTPVGGWVGGGVRSWRHGQRAWVEARGC